MALDSLRVAVRERLAADGTLGRLQTELRLAVFAAASGGAAPAPALAPTTTLAAAAAGALPQAPPLQQPPAPLPPRLPSSLYARRHALLQSDENARLALALMADFCDSLGLTGTASVLAAETGFAPAELALLGRGAASAPEHHAPMPAQASPRAEIAERLGLQATGREPGAGVGNSALRRALRTPSLLVDLVAAASQRQQQVQDQARALERDQGQDQEEGEGEEEGQGQEQGREQDEWQDQERYRELRKPRFSRLPHGAAAASADGSEGDGSGNGESAAPAAAASFGGRASISATLGLGSSLGRLVLEMSAGDDGAADDDGGAAEVDLSGGGSGGGGGGER